MALATTPESGVGITLSTKASGGSYAVVTQIKDDCEFDGWETDKILIKLLTSGTVGKTPGRSDYGSFTGSAYLVMGDAGFLVLLTLFGSKAIQSWQLQLADDVVTPANSSTATFNGFVSKFTPGNFTGDDAPAVSFEIAISGVVTLTPGT
jgi:hypothetical protein